MARIQPPQFESVVFGGSSPGQSRRARAHAPDRSKWIAVIPQVGIWLVMTLCCAAGIAQAGSPGTGVDPALSELIARCAPTVHPETMAAVISAESRGHQYAIADAGPVNMPWAQRKSLVRSFYMGSLDSAVAKAEELISNGHTVSLGFSQVNDRNLRKLGLSVRAVFDPCTNVAAGGQILTTFYRKAASQFGPGARALRASISAYNSGDWMRGEKDGYVDLVYRQVGRPLSVQSAVVVPVTRTRATTRVAMTDSSIGRNRVFGMTVTEFAAE